MPDDGIDYEGRVGLEYESVEGGASHVLLLDLADEGGPLEGWGRPLDSLIEERFGRDCGRLRVRVERA